MRLSHIKWTVLPAVAFVLLYAATWVGAGTTGIISGVVKNAQDDAPISGANIFVGNTKLTAVTDASGYFVITNVAPGDYEVRAEMVGYGTATQGSVQVAMDVTASVEFEMKQEAITEAEVVVTRPRPMINTEATNTLNQLTAGQQDMARSDPASLHTVPGVLSALPGVVVDPDGMGSAHFRGGRSDQVGYYIEGIPVTDPNTGFFSTNLFTTGVSRFQSYPGGSGAEFGNAISGVLNEVKMTGSQLKGVNLDTQGGNQTFRSGFAEVGGETPDGFSYYAGSILQENDMTGAPELVSQQYADSMAKLVWPMKNDKITVLALQGSLAGFMKGFHNTGNYDQPTPYENDFVRQRYLVSAVSWSHNFSPKSFLTVQPYYIDCGTVINAMGGFMNSWSAQKGLQLNYTGQLSEKHLFKAGGSLLQSTNSYYLFFSPDPYLRADVNTLQNALFVEDQMKISDRLTAQLGARYESITYDRTGRQWVEGEGYSGDPIGDVSQHIVTPRAGLSYAVDERTAWKTSWGRYSKWLPSYTVQSVYFDPDDPYTEAYTAGLGATEPQKSTSIDLSYEKQVTPSVALRITPFYAKYENLGDNVYDNDTGITSFANLGEGRSSGVEVYLRKKLADNWQGWLSYTYSSTKANRADMGYPNDLFYTSWDQRHRLSLVSDYRTGPWAHGLRADVGSGRADIAYYNPLLQQRAKSFVVVTYNVSYDLPAGSRLGNSIYLSIYNVFNNRQAMQYSWDYMETRSANSLLPERFVSLGLTRAF